MRTIHRSFCISRLLWGVMVIFVTFAMLTVRTNNIQSNQHRFTELVLFSRIWQQFCKSTSVELNKFRECDYARAELMSTWAHAFRDMAARATPALSAFPSPKPAKYVRSYEAGGNVLKFLVYEYQDSGMTMHLLPWADVSFNKPWVADYDSCQHPVLSTNHRADLCEAHNPTTVSQSS